MAQVTLWYETVNSTRNDVCAMFSILDAQQTILTSGRITTS